MGSIAENVQVVNSRDGRPPTAYFIAPHDRGGVRAWFLLGEKRIERGPVRGTKKTLRNLQSRRGHLEIPTPPQYAIDAVAAMEKGTAPATSSVGVYSIVTDTNDPYPAIPLDIIAGGESGANRAEGGDQ